MVWKAILDKISTERSEDSGIGKKYLKHIEPPKKIGDSGIKNKSWTKLTSQSPKIIAWAKIGLGKIHTKKIEDSNIKMLISLCKCGAVRDTKTAAPKQNYGKKQPWPKQ